MNNEDYKARLDSDILFMLRIRAMDEGVVPKPTYKDVNGGMEALTTFLGSQEESEKYFENLSDAIGYEVDGGMKRVPVSRQSAWEKVKYVLNHARGAIVDNIHPVTIDGKVIDNHTVMVMLAKMLGYNSGGELHDAVIIRGYDLPESNRMIDVEQQNFIAMALGKKSWADLHGKDDAKRKISVTALKRFYGKVKSTSNASKQKLDYIAEFIADTSWENLQRNKDMLMNEISKGYVVFSSRSRFLYGRPRGENAKVIYSSRLLCGDKVTLTYLGGNYLEMEFMGDYTFKVLNVRSNILKTGYYLTTYEIHLHKSLHSNEIYDENGDMLDMMYDSSIVEEIHFMGVPRPPRKRPSWLKLNEHKLP